MGGVLVPLRRARSRTGGHRGTVVVARGDEQREPARRNQDSGGTDSEAPPANTTHAVLLAPGRSDQPGSGFVLHDPRHGTSGGAANPGDGISLQCGDVAQQIAQAVPGDDLARHLADAP